MTLWIDIGYKLAMKFLKTLVMSLLTTLWIETHFGIASDIADSIANDITDSITDDIADSIANTPPTAKVNRKRQHLLQFCEIWWHRRSKI